MKLQRWRKAVIGFLVVVTTLVPAMSGFLFRINVCPTVIQVYHKYVTAIGTCSNVNNYGCRVEESRSACSFRCIDASLVCDGTPDCPLGDDETNCTSTSSTSTSPTTTSSSTTVASSTTETSSTTVASTTTPAATTRSSSPGTTTTLTTTSASSSTLPPPS